MRRAIVVVCFCMGLATLISAAPAPAPAVSVPQKLAQRVKFDGIDDPKTTLDDALDKVSKLYDVAFDVNDKAFKFENVMDVGKTEVASPAAIRPMKNARLSTVLRKILSRIPVPSGAVYCLRADHIEITTGTFQAVEIWGPSYQGPRLPLVNALVNKAPLEDAVKELAEQSDFNVLLDNRAADKTKTPISAKLLNTPLDTALRLLADMADLRSVQLDNVLYVTTKENAAALEARLEKEKGPMDDNAPENGGPAKWRKGSGPGNISVSGANGGM